MVDSVIRMLYNRIMPNPKTFRFNAEGLRDLALIKKALNIKTDTAAVLLALRDLARKLKRKK